MSGDRPASRPRLVSPAPARDELEVMEHLANAGAERLSPEAQLRVLRWYADFLGLPVVPGVAR